MAATQRIIDFLATRRPAGPCLVVDLDVVRDNFNAFRKALPESRFFTR
jgi:ornithine decarboxylase